MRITKKSSRETTQELADRQNARNALHRQIVKWRELQDIYMPGINTFRSLAPRTVERHIKRSDDAESGSVTPSGVEFPWQASTDKDEELPSSRSEISGSSLTSPHPTTNPTDK